ncbi:MAG TPA: WbqC family protein [Bacteroidales bacterium]|nr:WbqC family protein [Bacteroidales bacterium]
MPGKLLFSTAYLPPIDYFALITRYGKVSIEANENYIKQSYRNRCYILSSHGPHLLSVPVYEGSRHKIPIKEARIDYSKRWQQVHSRAIVSSYRCSPYFEYFYDQIEKTIFEKHEFLWDLNLDLLNEILKILKLRLKPDFTQDFEPLLDQEDDYRHNLEPGQPLFEYKKYMQVFRTNNEFIPNLSIIDLIFNLGPDATAYLEQLTPLI